MGELKGQYFCTMFWILVIGVIATFLGDRCDAQEIPKTKFSCSGRITGYYADVSTGCQVYHMCDGLGRQFSYTCPNATLFQQRMLICDHWYMVNCSKAESDYSANLLIGQKGKPFVDDVDYHRTPRPDLLHPGDSEYNIIYRTGRGQNQNSKNVVGAEEETVDKTSSDEPTYFPPSHWSTEYKSQSTTQNPSEAMNENRRLFKQNNNNNNNNNYYMTSYKKTNVVSNKAKAAKAIDLSSINRNGNTFVDPKQKPNRPLIPPPTPQPGQISVNFKSNFKATTPVFPQSAPSSTVSTVNFKSDFKATTPVFPTSVDHSKTSFPGFDTIPLDSKPLDSPSRVNFESNFKATTPVYPTSVDATSVAPDEAGLLPPIPYQNLKGNPEVLADNQIHVNFESNFKATTPNYPTSVEPTSPDPGEVGLLPPNGTNSQDNTAVPNEIPQVTNVDVPSLSLSFEPPKFDNKYQEIRDTLPETTPAAPSMFYQPPKFLPDFTEEKEKINFRKPDYTLSMKPEQWEHLREMLHIPDYDFPLDPATRPSYESKLSSFEAKAGKKR